MKEADEKSSATGTDALLRELVAHLRQHRTELREEWARRITDAKLLTTMSREEIFAEATSVYNNYVETLETGTLETLHAYARNLSERIIPRGVETHEVLGIVLLLRDVLARSLFAKYQSDFKLLNRVLDAVEQLEIALVLGEQGSRQHVAQQQNDPQHLVGLDPPRDDALGEVARIRMQRLERPRLQRLDVVVVYGGGLGKDFLSGHRGQELGVRDAPRPLLAQLGAVLAQMRNQFAEQGVGARGAGFFVGLFHGEPPCSSPLNV